MTNLTVLGDLGVTGKALIHITLKALVRNNIVDTSTVPEPSTYITLQIKVPGM